MHLFFLFVFWSILCSFSLADRMFQAKPGEYLVSEQEKNYSLLLVREQNQDHLLLEEVTVPSHLINLSTVDWKQWLESGAPGHTAWTQYEIEPHTCHLIEAYSFSKKGWLHIEEAEHFLPQLLQLPLSRVTLEERRKIGVAPHGGEVDRRPLWNPILQEQGEKHKYPCDVWKTRWPQDDSILSSCQILIYFPSKEVTPFPLWIEVSNGHVAYSIKTIAVGKDLSSPLKTSFPKRPPSFLKGTQKTQSSLQLPIQSPRYYKSFLLYAFDLLTPSKQIGPIPFSLLPGEKKELFFLDIQIHDLEKIFTEGHRYKWTLVPRDAYGVSGNFSIESPDIFYWR